MAKKNKEIFGMLAHINAELPYKTKKEKQEADKLNAEMQAFGFRTARIAYDWGYRAYEGVPTREQPQKFRSGDLVKIFKTVSDGDIQWQGKIDFDRTDYHHGLQKGLPAKEWSSMFSAQLPAKLERDGKVIYGSLEPFCETGTEGIVWSVHEYGKKGYDGLNCLEDGDKLTVYSSVRDGEVEWQGRLRFGRQKVENIGWSEVMRPTRHLPTEEWLQMTFQNRPVAVTPK